MVKPYGGRSYPLAGLSVELFNSLPLTGSTNRAARGYGSIALKWFCFSLFSALSLPSEFSEAQKLFSPFRWHLLPTHKRCLEEISWMQKYFLNYKERKEKLITRDSFLCMCCLPYNLVPFYMELESL